MSNIGKQAIILPQKVSLEIFPEKIMVSGPLGKLFLKNYPWFEYNFDSKRRKLLILIRQDLSNDLKIFRQRKQLWGTLQKDLSQKIIGVSQGYIFPLKLVGLGYRAQIEENSLHLKLGTTHPIILDIPKDLTITCVRNTKIILQGTNYQEITSFASKIRSFRPPEPYKGKGIFAKGEKIRRKEGKKKITFKSKMRKKKKLLEQRYKFSFKEMLRSRLHLGNTSKTWNPKMSPYLYTIRNGLYIINLEKTLIALRVATQVIYRTVALGGKILFICTHPTGMLYIQKIAEKTENYFINKHWLGGTLTNFKHLTERFNEKLSSADPKKTSFLEGVRYMEKLPDLIVVWNTSQNETAIREARALNIPIIGIVDTDSDPSLVDYVIPANDDSARSIFFICRIFYNAITDGKKAFSLYELKKTNTVNERKEKSEKKTKI